MIDRTASSRNRRMLIGVLGVATIAVVAMLVLLLVSLREPSEREVDLLVNVLGIREGATIGEIGAGDGWLSVEVARRVGPSGRVYSTELDGLDQIRASAQEAGLSNVTVVAAGERSTNLAPGSCDAVFMRRVYHHLEDPTAIVADINRTLKPQGRLAIIEFESGGLLGAVTREGIDRADLIDQVTRGGFELITVADWPGIAHYVAVFRKAGDSGQ